MSELCIVGTKDTPEIKFDPKQNLLVIKGKSYPENTSEFYFPVFSWLNEFLGRDTPTALKVIIELYYFNSSSSKILLDLCDLLEEFANKGRRIEVNWLFEQNDEDSFEFGEILKEDYHSIQFTLVEKKDIP